MSAIFISHATADDDAVNRLYRELHEKIAPKLWVDHRELTPPLDNFRKEIHQAMKDSDGGVLLVLSRTSVTRPEVDGEWTYCLNATRPLYVVKIDDVPVMEINPRLHIVQWIDLSRDWDAGIRALAAAISGEKLPEDAPVVVARHVTGEIDRRLTITPLRGREKDLAAVKTYLKSAPTCILGVGGLGKSRLAAEIALTSEDVQGVIWHRVTEFSRDYDVMQLINEHFDLPPTSERREMLAKLRTARRLVVFDNAEDVPPNDPRYNEYVRLANELHANKAQVLVTSRMEWEALNPVKKHEPTPLDTETARQIVLDMGATYDVAGLEPYADAIAEAARQHPRLIEWAVGQMGRFPPEKVIADLKGLKSQRVQDALDEMVQKTLEKMVALEAQGARAEAALRRLLVCRGGMTYAAAAAALGVVPLTPQFPLPQGERGSNMEMDDFDTALDVLQRWRFVTYDSVSKRYDLPLVVIAALKADMSAYLPHYEYYLALAWQHDKQQDYYGLEVESENLEAAFEWAMSAGEYEKALNLMRACGQFLRNRGRFAQALDWSKRVVGALEDQSDKMVWANALNILGVQYQSYPLGDRHDNLKRAVSLYQAALVYHTPQAAPLDYAMTQNNLGNAYADLAQIEDRVDNLKRAVAAYQAALVYRTPHATPLYYAATQNNLGTAYADLAGIEERADNLKRAVAALEAALVVYTPQTAPLYYATTQNNLGTAYADLAGIEHRHDNLKRAVAAYEAALLYSTPQAAPLSYAGTQYNLGNAYAALAKIEDRADNLKRAVAAYEAALVYRTPQAAPLSYATTQANLGVVHEDLGDLPAAMECWREAETYYRLMRIIDKAEKMLRWIARAEARLSAGEDQTPP